MHEKINLLLSIDIVKIIEIKLNISDKLKFFNLSYKKALHLNVEKLIEFIILIIKLL